MEEKQKNSPEEIKVEKQTIFEEELANVTGGGCVTCSICKHDFSSKNIGDHMEREHGISTGPSAS